MDFIDKELNINLNSDIKWLFKGTFAILGQDQNQIMSQALWDLEFLGCGAGSPCICSLSNTQCKTYQDT